MIKHHNKHEFAIFYENLSKVICDKVVQCTIYDVDLSHRIGSVIRLNSGELIRLFDRFYNVLFHLDVISKKYISGVVLSRDAIVSEKRELIVFAPLLKKDAFEDLLYNCVELGVSRIIPIYYKKSISIEVHARDVERWNKIMISAAEQSKNFALPLINSAIQFDKLDFKQFEKSNKLLADPDGASFLSLMVDVLENANSIVIAAGPEGALVESEINILQYYGFIKCRLTPTILRSQQAITVLAGMIRSL